MAQILVVDDQEDIVQFVVKALELQNHKVTGLTSVLDLDKNSLPRFDLILLDIMMPDVDGLQFCHDIRDQVDCPILFITAKTQEADIVQGLTYGADDYICKPFGVKELQARVAAHLRREHRERHHKLSLGDFQFDLSAQELYVENQLLDLTRSEYRICQFLAENKGQVFSKEQIYTHLYGYEDKGSPTAVAEHIKISVQSSKMLGKILLKQSGGLVTSGTNKKTRILSKNNLVILCRQPDGPLGNQQSSYFVFVQLVFSFWSFDSSKSS